MAKYQIYYILRNSTSIVYICVNSTKKRGFTMSKKLLITGAVASIILLAGCSNKTEMMQDSLANLTNQVGELSDKVDMMASDHASMKADLQAVASETERANARIDNIATSYKK